MKADTQTFDYNYTLPSTQHFHSLLSANLIDINTQFCCTPIVFFLLFFRSFVFNIATTKHIPYMQSKANERWARFWTFLSCPNTFKYLLLWYPASKQQEHDIFIRTEDSQIYIASALLQPLHHKQAIYSQLENTHTQKTETHKTAWRKKGVKMMEIYAKNYWAQYTAVPLTINKKKKL